MVRIQPINWTSFILHLLFWIIFFSIPFIMHPDLLNARNSPRFIINFYGIRYAAWISLFYLNAHVLVPKFIYSKTYLKYFFIQFGIMGALYLLHVILARQLSTETHLKANPFIFTIIPYIFIWACSTAYQLIRQKITSDKVSNEREKENLKTELSFLRSQVSPHFMFNVLNNMVSLARKKSEDLEPSLIKFASLLRYTIYETGDEKKMLSQEISYLKSFIELQQQRFGKSIHADTSFQAEEIDYAIEPMLLIPFVENAFKHGMIAAETAPIVIKLYVEQDILFFQVRNKFDIPTRENEDTTHGIGLANVKRRLELLYANNYVLDISSKDGWFFVYLQLNLT